MSTVTNYQFAMGDGVTADFDLTNPDGTISDTPVVTTIYKTVYLGVQAVVAPADYAILGSVVAFNVIPLNLTMLAWTGTDANGPFNPRQDGTSMSGKFGTQGVV